ncbi:MAG: hypothetical protein QXZ70_00510 [Candidatus Bathyarchaeia archaeon]
MALSKKEMVKIIVAHKNNIEENTSQIKEKLQDVQPVGKPLDKETTRFVQQKVDSVIKELSIVGSFCGRGEKNYVYKVSDIIGRLTAPGYIDYYIAVAIRFWCTMVNSIMIDFNKTPFKFFGSFKIDLKNLETQVRTLFQRK